MEEGIKPNLMIVQLDSVPHFAQQDHMQVVPDCLDVDLCLLLHVIRLAGWLKHCKYLSLWGPIQRVTAKRDRVCRSG